MKTVGERQMSKSANLSVRLYAVLEAVELPAGIAHLAARLSDVYRDAFSLEKKDKGGRINCILIRAGHFRYFLIFH